MVQGDRCTLMATDLEQGIRLEVRSPKVLKPGDAILPASRLLSILRESTDDRLTIEADAERDRWFTAEEAKEYGLVDKVIVKRGEIR